jgi:hypothetical protein
MVVIGGLGSLPGAVMGAVYVRAAEFFLPAAWSLLASGLGILFLLMFLPEGLGGLVYRARDIYLRRVANKHGLIVPSLLADRRVVAEDAPVVIDTALSGLTGTPVTVEQIEEVEHDILTAALDHMTEANEPEPAPEPVAANGSRRRRSVPRRTTTDDDRDLTTTGANS